MPPEGATKLQVEHSTANARPQKRAKPSGPIFERGPDLVPEKCVKCLLKLPKRLTPGAVQSNRVGLLVNGDAVAAYVSNAQHTYEVSLDTIFAAGAGGEVAMGKEGVLVPQAAQVGHIRQLDALSDMAAEVQSLASCVQGGHHLLAVTDALGNARILATPLHAGASGGAAEGGAAEGSSGRHLLQLPARSRGECGWTGLVMRPSAPEEDGSAGAASSSGDGGGGGQQLPELEVAVARQLARDVCVYRGGQLVRSFGTAQVRGPTALTFLPSGQMMGGCGNAASGLLAVAEEHQVALWDVRQGERGGCVQRVNAYNGGWPLYGLAWVAGAVRDDEAGGPAGGLLAVTGAERSVVMLEPRKWHIATKWAGCVKYPATHLAPSAAAPGHVYVAGLDYECAAGRWDGSSGGAAGNANSSSGGHGRAVLPPQLQARGLAQEAAASGGAVAAAAAAAAAAAVLDDTEGGGRAGLSFRGDSKWLGLAHAVLPASASASAASAGVGGATGGRCRDLLAALSLSGNLFVLTAGAAAEG
ncbi:hypothetical protein HYH02_008492 [Chlamydomonas schloesseri]|uniref:Uncharacterized protein n=1 Tax=Chlamydomonas schloesseri TaxID=2026947 RepID=A0A835WFL3_9CHLO|nr:hypothetical protein HYH02_008492 [Chlamydomonas schloesseri]|eukprot:KAG2446501.1 hypothetical protein HYH02_008492 [Chlamydomonas schloesseri]